MFVTYVSLEAILWTKGSITDSVMRCGSNFATIYWGRLIICATVSCFGVCCMGSKS